MKELPHDRMSRRNFLKVAGVFAASVATYEAAMYSNTFVKEEGPTLKFSKETDICYGYEGEAGRVIDEVYAEYGLPILSPKEWLGEPNLPWPDEAVVLVANALRLLPADYLYSFNLPKYLFLNRIPGTSSPYAGGLSFGGFGEFHTSLFVSDGFSFDNCPPGVELAVYGDARRQMLGTVCHEFTHIFVFLNPVYQNLFNEAVGWFQNEDGLWVNLRPENLMHEAEADVKPYEDIAVSAARMLINPDALSEDRKKFFRETLLFSKWIG